MEKLFFAAYLAPARAINCSLRDPGIAVKLLLKPGTYGKEGTASGLPKDQYLLFPGACWDV